jgi:hypothetical protein
MDVAEAGNCVIVRRGSAYYLRSRQDTVHVFIYAFFQGKVRRLQAIGKGETRAIELAQTVDVNPPTFIKEYFHVDWSEDTVSN